MTTSSKLRLDQIIEERPWLTERYLRRLVYERRIPYYKVGQRLLFDLSDIDAFVERGRRDPQPAA